MRRLTAVLDRRLDPGGRAPIGVALSGGGDSLALLALTLDWARAHGRRVLALTVDHGLQPQSAAWTAQAGTAARALGADWTALRWQGVKPLTGVSAAARQARHALIAEAAREAGASVVLFGHTRDDRAEAAAMRAEGSTVPDPREWAPSPAWPEGRGVFVLRPLLEVSREALRAVLRQRGLSWIEDPANLDPTSARARARAARNSASVQPPAAVLPPPRGSLAVGAAGEIGFARRDIPPPHVLAAVLLCASGQTRPPRGDALARLQARLAGEGAFTATLAGARVEAGAAAVLACRDLGRAGVAALRLLPGRASIWDGRFEIIADRACEVRPLKGLMAGLSPEDRQAAARFPAAVRPTLPVLIGAGDPRPLLAERAASVRVLAGPRLRAACGQIAHEREIEPAPRGAATSAPLC